MAFINEETKHPRFQISITVVEQQRIEESYGNGKFISLESDGYFEDYSPEDLIEIGNWLIGQANRIGSQYSKKTGKKKSK